MAVTIRNVEFMNNPARFSDVYRFRVTFECIAPLEDGKDHLIAPLERELTNRMLDLEWRLIFVSCPGDEALDQELDDCLVGPVPQGINSFEFEGSAPDPSRIPDDDVLGVAALILTGSYRDQEFVRVGYYQNTEYDNDEMKETPPPKIIFNRLVRDISAKPRVTRFHIKWDVSPPQATQAALGAATSAPVPSADDINNGDDEMEVDFSKNANGIP